MDTLHTPGTQTPMTKAPMTTMQAASFAHQLIGRSRILGKKSSLRFDYSRVEGIEVQVNQLLAESPVSKSDRKKDKRPVRMVSMDHAGFQLWQRCIGLCSL